MSYRLESSGIAWQRTPRGRWLSVLTGLLAAALVCGAVASGLDHRQLGRTALALFAGSVVVMLARAFAQREPEGPGAIAVKTSTLIITREGERWRVPLKRLTGAWIQRTPPRRADDEGVEVDVHVELAGGETSAVRVANRAEGERLIQALGFAPSDRVVRMPLSSDAAARPPGELLAAIALVFLIPATAIASFAWIGMLTRELATGDGPEELSSKVIPGALVALFALALHRVTRFLRRNEVRIGRDGLLVRRTWGKELISYDDIERVDTVPKGVELTLRGGARRVLPVVDMRRYREDAGEAAQDWQFPAYHEPIPYGRGGQWTHEDTVFEYLRCARAVGRRDALRERIEAVMALRGARALSAAQIEQLDQRGRDARAWREELRGLLSADGEGSYRRARLEREALIAVVEDGGAPPKLRVAAAVALFGSSELAPRVRIAAEAAADEDLRQALSRAAEGEIDEAALERATERRPA